MTENRVGLIQTTMLDVIQQGLHLCQAVTSERKVWDPVVLMWSAHLCDTAGIAPGIRSISPGPEAMCVVLLPDVYFSAQRDGSSWRRRHLGAS